MILRPLLRVSLVAVSFAMGCAVGSEPAKCRVHELPAVPSAKGVTYADESLPWVIYSEDLSGILKVTDHRNGASCTISTYSDSRPQVYAGEKQLAVRITEASSDDIAFYDPATCRKLDEPPPVHLAATSEGRRESKLSRLGICPVDGRH